MVSGERIKVTLTGGAPWGFRLAGGGSLPLTVNKIRKKSQAHVQGLVEGDAVLTINGIPVHDKSQDGALEMVEKSGDTLVLEIFRGDIEDLGHHAPKSPAPILAPTAVTETQASGDTGLALTATVDEVSSSTFTLGDDSVSSGLTLTATVDDMSASSYTPAGSATPSGITFDAVLNETVTGSSAVGSGSTLTPVFGEVTLDAKGHSPTPKKSVSPQPVTPAPQPKPSSPAPPPKSKSPVPPPKPASQPPAPKPVSQPPAPKPVSQPPAPKPAPPQPKSVAIAPVTGDVKSSVTSSTFDDGKTKREFTREQHVQKLPDGTKTRVVQTERTSTVSTSKAPGASTVQRQQSTTTTTTSKSTTVVGSQNPAVLQQQQQTSAMSTSDMSKGMVPTFKPSKFVPGGGSYKEIPGLYNSEIDTSVTGKENVAPNKPMFQVRNVMSETFKPNMWIPGQETKQQTQKYQQKPQQLQVVTSASYDDFSPYPSYPVPKVQTGKMSLVDQQRKRLMESSYDYDAPDEYDGDVHEVYTTSRGDRLHVFAPPVEMHPPDDFDYDENAYYPYNADGEPIFDYDREGPTSPDSATYRRRKNLYADSAFYDTPGKSYPTIQEQMRLCKKIAQSLTSAANRRARGAKMFMKRKKRSTKWIHEGQSEWSSSAGDVANIHDLDSELSPDEGGSKPLFYFKIPNLKHRIGDGEKNVKMALTPEQFERLRLNSNKCDHKNVSPNQCFTIAADLKSSRGRGGRLFERRKQRSEKFVVDDSSRHYGHGPAALESVLKSPVAQDKTPWQAAMSDPAGNVDAAFQHISDMERNQKLNQILKYSEVKKPMATPFAPSVRVPQANPIPLHHTSLKADHQFQLIGGKNFNRTARGWMGESGGGVEQFTAVPYNVAPVSAPLKGAGHVHIAPPPPTGPPSQQRDFNNKIRAWKTAGASPYIAPAPDKSRPRSWQSDGYEAASYDHDYDYTYVPLSYAPEPEDYHAPAYMQPIVPGTDL